MYFISLYRRKKKMYIKNKYYLFEYLLLNVSYDGQPF